MLAAIDLMTWCHLINGSRDVNISLYFAVKNYLGSILVLMNFEGNIVERYNYDAWGRRRNPDTWEYTNVPEPTLIDFGFTSHEHWDKVNIINMTGRLYDPYLARVLNPDPFVSDPGSSQALNRYTYAMNNPYVYFDPNGKNVRKKFHQFRRWFRDKVWYPITDAINGKPNPETMEYEGGLAQQFQEWGVPSFEAGYNTSRGFFYSVNGNEPIYLEQAKVNSYAKAADVTYRARSQAASYGVYHEDNSLYLIEAGVNAAGFASTAREYSIVINGRWRGVNGKWYSLEWGGNQWTGARANALRKAGYFKLASRGLFVVGTGISLYQGAGALLRGDYAGATKSVFDIGMGAFATYGGPLGWVIGGGYFALDALGAFDRRMITTSYIQPNCAVRDNTYVAPPKIRYP